MANTWTSLFNRYGFETTQEGVTVDVSALTNENRCFLESLLDTSTVNYRKYPLSLEIKDDVMEEGKWQEVQELLINAKTEMSFHPDSLQIATLDLYIAGLVIQLNRLNFHTVFSCDGHEKRSPHISFNTAENARKTEILFQQIGINCNRKGRELRIREQRNVLPGAAEVLSNYTMSEVERLIWKSDSRMGVGEFNSQLETLLNIPGESGKESQIRNHILNEITPIVDHVTVDHYGNILAEKRYCAGPVILLNAHIDTVDRIEASRVIIKENNIWSSSKGILGADDRAGVNVILSILKSLTPKEVKGTLKIIFTVEEEIGLVGASEVSESFLWNVDMALVIDRRGTTDIVTHNNSQEFCSPRFGRSLERIARANGLGNWSAVRGGSSDTGVWASHHIQSVNLSAGYLHEHTSYEQLDVEANYNTYLFVTEILGSAQRLYSEQRMLTAR